MLKSQLEKELHDGKEALHLRNSENSALIKLNKGKNVEIKNLTDDVEILSTQLKKISQSIYTIIQIRYPDGSAFNQNDTSDEERFLRFLHSLCVDKDYCVNSVGDVFRHLS